MSRSAPLLNQPRLFVRDDLKQNQHIVLSAVQTHYLKNVLRLDSGRFIRVFNGRDGEWQAEIHNEKKGVLEIRVLDSSRKQEPEPDIRLLCAPVKKAFLDFMVMKTTELGVSHIRPLLTSRTQIRNINADHMLAVAVEAAEQSERLSVPEIGKPETLEQALRNWPEGVLPVVCTERGEAVPVAKAFRFRETGNSPPVGFITGPEGGFSDGELESLLRLPHVLTVRLGPRILRAETAAVAVLACWQALCGDWR